MGSIRECIKTVGTFANNLQLLITEPIARKAFSNAIADNQERESVIMISPYKSSEELIDKTNRERVQLQERDPNEMISYFAAPLDGFSSDSDNKIPDGKPFGYFFVNRTLQVRLSPLMQSVLHILDYEWRFRQREHETLLDVGPSSYMSTTETVTQHIHGLFDTVTKFYESSKAAQKYLHPVFFQILPFLHELEEIVVGDTTLDRKDEMNHGAKVNHTELEYSEHIISVTPGIDKLIARNIPGRDVAVKWLAHTIALFDHFSKIDGFHPLALDLIVGRFYDTYEGNKRWLADKKARKITVSNFEEFDRLLRRYANRSASGIKVKNGTDEQYEITIPAVDKLDAKSAAIQARKIQSRFQVYIQKMRDIGIPKDLFDDVMVYYKRQIEEFRLLGVVIEQDF